MQITANSAVQFHCPRWNELPNLPLYMDQVIIIVNQVLGPFFKTDESLLTKTMVNNYVKNRDIRPPVKKKYGREHIASLIIITLFKRVLSLSEIGEIMHTMVEFHGNEAAYDIFCQHFEEYLAETFAPGTRTYRIDASEHRSVNILNAALTALIGKLLVLYYLDE